MIAKGILDRKAEITQQIPGGGIKISTTFIVNSGAGLRIYQNHNQEGYCPPLITLSKENRHQSLRRSWFCPFVRNR